MISEGKRSSQQFYSTKRSVVVLAAVAAAAAVVVVGGPSNRTEGRNCDYGGSSIFALVLVLMAVTSWRRPVLGT